MYLFLKKPIVYQKLGISPKKIKFLRVPTVQSLSFSLKLCACVLLRNAYKMVLRKLHVFWIDRSKSKNKTKKSTHRFLDIATYNIYAKFQGKIVNPTLVEAPGSLRFLNKRNCFFCKKQVFIKNRLSVFFSAEPV